MKYTPEIITSLEKNQIFVFGSNESGIHGAGAAAFAQRKFGAVRGQGFGLAGQTFAIPTKDWSIQSLPLENIEFYVQRFIAFAEIESEFEFLVTKIGCGLAGFTIEQIAPMFSGEMPSNIILPEEFHNY